MILCSDRACHDPADVRIKDRDYPFGKAVCSKHVADPKKVLQKVDQAPLPPQRGNEE